MNRLTPEQRAKIREIEARWSEPQRVSRFGWLRCLIGRHDWDQYGECRRNWQHVQGRYDPVVWELYGGPWSRVYRLRQLDRQRLGEKLQQQLRALGEDPTLEMCKAVAADSDLAASVLEVARIRKAARDART